MKQAPFLQLMKCKHLGCVSLSLCCRQHVKLHGSLALVGFMHWHHNVRSISHFSVAVQWRRLILLKLL